MMSFHYANLGTHSLDNMLQMFGPIATNNEHPDLMNQLTAALMANASAASTANSISNSATSSTISSTVVTAVGESNTKRNRTPDPPPAPKLSSLTSLKMMPHQGTAPMDLENDSEPETTAATTTTTVTVPTSAAAVTVGQRANVDANLYLNGLMSAGINTGPGGYMYFPTAPPTATPGSGPPTANSMLLDHGSMMAAAMQQMQPQSYAGYAMAQDGTNDGSAVAGNAADASKRKPQWMFLTKTCSLWAPNPNAPKPTTRERPPGCRTVFVGGLPENITEEIIRDIFKWTGEITTLRMSKKNFCHIRFRRESSIDAAIFMSGYRVQIANDNDPANFGRLHVDYAQARDDQYDYECKQRQLQREQRHRERLSLDRLRSQSPPPMTHYTEHEASLVAENLRNNETFVKAVQTISAWLERGDCTKRNANVFYSMIQSTHAHVRRLYTDKQQLEEELRKSRECYRKQMLTMSSQFTQIEKVFSAASHKKVWDHFTKAQRKNIDQWKKLASELRSVQIEDDEMEMSDDDRDYHSTRAKRKRFDSDSLKEENDSLRCQLEAIRNEMSLERTDIKCSSDMREKQIKVLQETIRNTQTQLLQMKVREQKDAATIAESERKVKEAGVKLLLMKTKVKASKEQRAHKRCGSSVNSEASEILIESEGDDVVVATSDDIRDVDKSDDDVKIVEDATMGIVQLHKAAEDDDADNNGDGDVGKDNDAKGKPPEIKTDISAVLQTDNIKDGEEAQSDEIRTKSITELDSVDQSNCLFLDEAKIIALSTVYLMVHPAGATSTAIRTYIGGLIKSLDDEWWRLHSLDATLAKYTNLFKAEAGDGTDVEVKWSFCGFAELSPLTAERKERDAEQKL